MTKKCNLRLQSHLQLIVNVRILKRSCKTHWLSASQLYQPTGVESSSPKYFSSIRVKYFVTLLQMNLPSFSREALATGLISLLFTLSGYSATPPVLNVKQTSLKIGPAVSGAVAHIDNHVYFAGGTTSTGSVTNAVSDVDTFHRTVTALAPMPTARAGLGLVAIFYNKSGTIDAL